MRLSATAIPIAMAGDGSAVRREVWRCWCPCPDRIERGEHPSAGNCKFRNAHLHRSVYKDDLLEKIRSHLKYSTYHLLPDDEVNAILETAEADGFIQVEVEEDPQRCNLTSNASPSQRMEPPRTAPRNRPSSSGRQSSPRRSPRRSLSRRSPQRAPTPTHGSVATRLTADVMNEQLTMGPHQPIVTMRLSEMELLRDSIDRAARASRNAERMSSAASTFFGAEALALEKARICVSFLLQRRG